MTDNGLYQEDTLVEEVKIGEMFMDPRYGRELHKKFVERMAATWDPRKAGVILLSMQNDGRFAVLDGWHRVNACRIAHGDDATMAAKVMIDLTLEQEAEYFDAFNRFRKAPFLNETFRARLTAKDPQALALQAIAEEFGIKISLGRTQERGEIRAVGVLERSFVALGWEEFRRVMRMLQTAIGSKDMAAKNIEGLADFWLRYADVADEDRVVHKMRDMGAKAWRLKAANLMAVREMITTKRFGGPYGMVLRAEYNKKMSSGRLPDWVTQGAVVASSVKKSRKELIVA